MDTGPRIFWLVALSVLVAGCSTTGGAGRRQAPPRGSLSEATAQAADDHEFGRGSGRTRTKTDGGVPAPGTGDQAEDDDDGGFFLFELIAGLFSGGDDDRGPQPADPVVAASAGQASAAAGPADPRNLVAWFSAARLGGDAIRSVTSVSFMYSFFRRSRLTTHLGVYYGEGRKGTQPVVQAGIDDLREYGFELAFRHYLTPDHTLMGLYLLGGARAGGLDWTYAGPVTAPTPGGSEILGNDSLFLATPYAGLGCALLQTRSVHLGASAVWGVRLAADETNEGYVNDLFVNVGELRLNLEVRILF